MNTYQSTPDFYRDYIQHFNKNHDPKNGQFASGHGGNAQINKKIKTSEKTDSKNNKIWEAETSKDPRVLKSLEKHKNDPYYVGSKAYNERNKRIEDWARKEGYTEDFIKYARKDAAGLGNVDDFEFYEMDYEDVTGKRARK